MKEPWCIATSLRDATPRHRRSLRQEMDDRPSFRTPKTSDSAWHERIADLRSTERDRLLLLNALAVSTQLLARPARASPRSASQIQHTSVEPLAIPSGCLLYDLIPNMPEHRCALIAKYAELLAKQRLHRDIRTRSENEGWLRRNPDIRSVTKSSSNRSSRDRAFSSSGCRSRGSAGEEELTDMTHAPFVLQEGARRRVTVSVDRGGLPPRL